MPWTSADATRHKKGLSGSSARKWADIANSVLSRTGDEAQAIRVANSRVKPSDNEAVRKKLREKVEEKRNRV